MEPWELVRCIRYPLEVHAARYLGIWFADQKFMRPTNSVRRRCSLMQARLLSIIIKA